MGLIKKQTAAIPPGEMLRFKVGKGEITMGDHGYQAQIEMETISPGPYKGKKFLTWSKLVADEDDGGKLKPSEGGRLYRTALACFHGDVSTIDSFSKVEKLLKAMEGKTFKSITKNRGKDGKFVDITWDQQYPDTEGLEDDSKEGPKGGSKEKPEPLKPQEHEPGDDLPEEDAPKGDDPEAPF
jgi:hypothetical protein